MRNKLFHYVKCTHCGQVGHTLTKLETFSTAIIDDCKYACLDKDVCEMRQRISIVRGGICGHWYCSEKSMGKCSCGIDICEVHTKGLAHAGHIVTKARSSKGRALS